ncbi:fimbrial protein [Serratia aquatilis]|uniref:Fimbrial protein n=1 Tax=Serratia aquatilis TaxID=1737515 RepID=A0ABV6EII4_9GAMM
MNRMNVVVPSLLLCCTLTFSGSALSAGEFGRGSVSMEGAIFDTPCTIDVGDQNQTVVVDTLTIEELAYKGQGPAQAFAIRLVDCLLPRPDLGQRDRQRFVMMFDGERDREHFGVAGTAQGVALRIQDARGQVAMPGETLPVAFMPGDPTLHYRVSLVASRMPLRAGEYYSAIRFRMDYY